MRLHLLSTLLVLAWLITAGMVRAQTPQLENWVEYVFGEQINFQARLHSETPVKSAVVFFQAVNDSRTGLGQVVAQPAGEGVYELIFTQDLAEYSPRSFSDINYHWEITLEDGEVVKGPSAKFFYDDNRYNWKILEEKPFRVHWSAGDLEFAQSVLDTAQEGLKQIQSTLPLPAPTHLEIYIYPEARAMQAALDPDSQDWVAGHADPDLGVVVVALPPGPEMKLLMAQRVPHELMHIMLYQSARQGYANLPAWLNEGLAAQAELYPNPDYRVALTEAARKDGLLPIAALCKTFPREAYTALLAYAESDSFTEYLLNTYGATGLQDLVTAYANGLDCERGAEYALGESLDQLERNWLWQAFPESGGAMLAAWNNLLPWVVILGAVLAAPLALLLYYLRPRPAHKQA